MTSLLRAYFAMPVWAQNVMISAYGVKLRSLRYGRYHRHVLGELLESQWLPAEELRALQLAKLNALLRHAAETVPFYQARGLPSAITSLEELTSLPLVTKDDLRTAGEAFVSSAVRRGSLVEIHTGGTTGTPLTVYCDRPTLQRNYAFFARLRHWAGTPTGARVATFAGRTFVPPAQKRPPYWRFNRAANTLLMSSYHLSPRTVDAYIERLRTFRPALIDSYPSSVEPIARRMLAVAVRSVRPRAVITSSETLFPETRALIARAFGCPVFDQYGAAEMAAFVAQCPEGAYHVNPEFGVVEVLKDGQPAAPGETGEIVATGFINPVMPLIRYATGDAAARGGNPCPCGRAFPILRQIEGRIDDVLITPEGRRIGRLDPIFKSAAALVEARIVQDAPDHVRLEVVPDVGYTAAGEATLLDELQRRLGPSMRIEVRRVASLPRERSGKVRMVVRVVALS